MTCRFKGGVEKLKGLIGWLITVIIQYLCGGFNGGAKSVGFALYVGVLFLLIELKHGNFS
jgi:hypothetical protein